MNHPFKRAYGYRSDDCLSIDLKNLTPILGEGNKKGKISWSDELYINFTYQAQADKNAFYRLCLDALSNIPVDGKLTLSYALIVGSHSIPVIQEIPLSRTTLASGGERRWMHCPQCLRRIGQLYFPPESSTFACHKCHNLKYESRRP